MTKASRWAWIASLVAVGGAGLVLFFLLSLATSNRAAYERHYVWLFWVNAVVAGVLALVIAVATGRLVVRLRRGRFGSRLLLRLVATYAFVGVVPGLLIYTVSYQFVSRSIESWFDVRVEGALDAGLNLGRTVLDAQVADLAAKTRLAAERMAESSADVQPLALERLREQLSASSVAIVGGAGQMLLTAGGAAALAPDRPSPALLRQARFAPVASQLEGLDDDTAAGAAATAAGGGVPARMRALAPIPKTNFSLGEHDRYLLVTQLVSTALAKNALAVQDAYREYQQRALARDGLRRMYIGTLTLALILAVFAALALAVTLGNQLARPLLVLAEGVRQVAAGDLRPKHAFASRDELGGLTRSFAEMTRQLFDARSQIERSVSELESARADLQTILDNLSAGVIVFDAAGLIATVNPGATRILRLPLSAYVGRRLDEVPGLEAFAAEVRQRFETQAARLGSGTAAGERDQWQDAFEVRTAPERDTLTLLVRGAAMPGDARLMVFDDITEVVSAQRTEAWSEVARRLAHEIKNPLTPIQLSAERLQHKLEAKLEGSDQAMLVRSVGTIVNQVQAMKRLVNEFRDYARLPSAHMRPLDLNELVAEVLALYATAQESGHLAADCEPRLPAVLGDATQLRQVIHNLVQNALDAVADQADGHVRVTTASIRGDKGEPRSVQLDVTDNGPGFSDKVLKRAFEPYVTTKSKGTGLGLAVVKKIADEHGARVRIANLADADPAKRGARVSLSFSNFPAAEGAASGSGAAAAREP